MFVALVPRMVNEKQARVDAARLQARDEKNIKTSWFFFYNLGTVVADHLRVSFCHVNEPCKENLDYFSWLSDLHAQTTCVWLIRNLGFSRWISFSFPIEHFSSHSYMFRTVATVKILLYLYVLYIYDGGLRPPSPPPPPEWVGSKTYVLATFSWNPPKHMVFTLFWQARPPKPWYLKRFVILHCILLVL